MFESHRAEKGGALNTVRKLQAMGINVLQYAGFARAGLALARAKLKDLSSSAATP
jgi:hypothetical protein